MRFYKERLPSLNSVVMTRVIDKNEYGYNVELIEYEINGFIPFSELYRRKIKKKNVIREGEQVPLIVLSIDDNVVNLSKNRVTEKESLEFSAEYRFASRISQIGNEIYRLYNKHFKDTNTTHETVCEHSIWRFYNQDDKPSQIWTVILNSIDNVLDDFFTDDFKIIVAESLNNRIRKITAISESVLSIKILTHNAVDDIKCLLSVKNTIGDLQIRCTCSPLYKLTLETDTSEQAEQELSRIVESIIDSAKNKFNNNCIINVHKPVSVIRQHYSELQHLSEYELSSLLL